MARGLTFVESKTLVALAQGGSLLHHKSWTFCRVLDEEGCDIYTIAAITKGVLWSKGFVAVYMSAQGYHYYKLTDAGRKALENQS